MPAPTLQAQGTTAAVTTGDLAITLPAYAANDIVIINSVGWVPNTTTGTNTMSLASPWTKYSPNVTTITSSIIDAEYAIWWARATSTSSLGTSVTITRPTSWDTGTDTAWAGRAYVIRGCNTTGNPFDAWTASAINTAANAAFPGVSYSNGNNLVVQFLCVADNTSVGTAPTGWTAGTEGASTTGTDTTFQTFRQTFSTATTATSTASTSSVAAPGNAGAGYVFFGVSFNPDPIARTATNSGTGTQSASGQKVAASIQRTASGTGTGTASATSKIPTLRTATNTATGTSLATSVFWSIITDIPLPAVGIGSSTTTSNFFSIVQRNGQSAAQGSSNNVYWYRLPARTAVGTGAGQSSSSRVVIDIRIATGNGAGFETASRLIIRPRTASITSISSQTAIGVRIVQRTGSGDASGQDYLIYDDTKAYDSPLHEYSSPYGEAQWNINPVRSATGQGNGTSVTSHYVCMRYAYDSCRIYDSDSRSYDGAFIAFATGAGTSASATTVFVITPRTASGSGNGSEQTTETSIPVRTAIGVGTGTSSSTPNVIPGAVRRTGTGAGFGSAAITQQRFVYRTSNNNGQSNEVTTDLLIVLRSSINAGASTSSVTYLRISLATAVGSGSGTDITIGAPLVETTAAGFGYSEAIESYDSLTFNYDDDDLKYADAAGSADFVIIKARFIITLSVGTSESHHSREFTHGHWGVLI